MTSVTFVEHDGTEHEIDGRDGDSVMRVALANDVPGIIGDCGGAAACATCHVYVDEEWASRIEKPSRDELDMVECAIDPGPTSRLSCQIVLSAALDGIRIRLPERQL